MKKNIVLFLLSILFFLLDNTIMTFFTIKGVYPTLLTIFAISYALIQEDWEALKIGVISGFLQDIYFGNVFGMNLLTNLLICVLASEIGKNIFKNKKLIPVLSVFALDTFKGIIIFLISYLLKSSINMNAILYKGIYDAIISIFMYSFVYKLCNKNYMEKEWKF